MYKSILLTALLLSGCSSPHEEPDADDRQLSIQHLKGLQGQVEQTQHPTIIPSIDVLRFKVERIDVLKDNMSTTGYRGVYLITDIVTGKQYLGISNMGMVALEKNNDSTRGR